MRLATLVWLFAACSASRGVSKQAPVTPAPIADVIAPAVAVRIEPAPMYNAPPAAPSRPDDGIGNDLVARLQSRSSVGRTSALDAVAADLAGVARSADLSPELVNFALQSHGIIEPVLATVVARDVEDDDVADELASQLADVELPASCYVGVGGKGPTVAVVVRELPIAVDAFPHVLPHRGELALSGWSDPRLTDLRARFTYADGHVHTVALPLAADGSFQGRLPCGDQDGANWLVVEAELAGTILLVPVYCGLQPPTLYWAEARQNLETNDVERRLAAIVNRERARLRLGALAPEARAQRAAHRHANAMRDARRLDHQLSGTVPVQRLRTEGLVAIRVSETTMHAQSLQAAAELLMNDARFRAQLERADHDRLAVAIAGAPDDMYIALLYLRVVAPVDVGQLVDAALARVKRSPAAARSLQVSPDLARLAQQLASASAAGWSQETIEKAYAADLAAARGSSSRTTMLLGSDDLERFPLAPDHPFDRVGVGVAQSSDSGPLAGVIWVVVLTSCHAKATRPLRRGASPTC